MVFNHLGILLTANVLCNLAHSSNMTAHRILGLFPVPIRSHYIFYETLLLELVRRGHHVDVVTHFPHVDPPERFVQLSLAGSMPALENNLSLADHDHQTVFHVAYEFVSLGNTACAASLDHPLIAKLKVSQVKYDLIVTEMFATDCLLPFAHIHNAPIVGMSSEGLMPWTDDRMGNPDNSAYISNYFHAQRGQLAFAQKWYSVAFNIGIKIWYYLLSTLPTEIHGRKVFGDTPTIESIAQHTAIFLANRHFSLDGPRPLVPGVIEVGGMHIKPAQIVEPRELLKFIENAPKGVIYFSMGTLINMSTFSHVSMNALMKVFASLEQRIVMKLHANDVRPSTNVYISTFLPQVDILCHPKTKLFITHGGTLSIQESAYCSVPLIGIPFYPHQEANVKNYVERGAGIHLPYASISETSAKNAIQEILANGTYAERAKRLSNLFKDRPKAPRETAVYWSEYAMKYGGRHIRSASADMALVEYLLLDIVIVALIVFGFFILYLLLHYLQEQFDQPLLPRKSDAEVQKKEN